LKDKPEWKIVRKTATNISGYINNILQVDPTDTVIIQQPKMALDYIFYYIHLHEDSTESRPIQPTRSPDTTFDKVESIVGDFDRIFLSKIDENFDEKTPQLHKLKFYQIITKTSQYMIMDALSSKLAAKSKDILMIGMRDGAFNSLLMHSPIIFATQFPNLVRTDTCMDDRDAAYKQLNDELENFNFDFDGFSSLLQYDRQAIS
jgi:hypothetical protein